MAPDADAFKSRLGELYEWIQEQDVVKIQSIYESLFKDLENTPWPSLSDVGEYGDNYIFFLLYQEMWHRHLVATSSPTLNQRIDSWNNYRALFQVAKYDTFGNLLPCQWLWDMVDGFVNQFHSFSLHRALHGHTQQFIDLLKQYHEAWSVYGVLRALQELMETSLADQIIEQAEDTELYVAFSDLQIATKYESNALKVLGYFSMVGLSRVHCLLGDYEAGLDCLPSIDTSCQGLYTALIDCHVTTIYHYGFANLMLGRYVDTIREFNKILVYIFKAGQPLQKSPHYEQTLIMVDQMYALLAICFSLCPPELRHCDECIYSQLKEKYGEKMLRMQRCNDKSCALYCELLAYAWPTFYTPFEPSSGDPREIFTQEDLDWYGEERLGNLFPAFFGTSAQSHVKPVMKHNTLAAVVGDMLKPIPV